MSRDAIRIGTRGSALALAQARLVADAFAREGRPTRLVLVETEGDRRKPDTPWGEGAFVAAIQHALCEGRVDVAVHSAKDVPTDEDPRLLIGAYLERADARDALIVRDGAPSQLDTLPEGSRVGTDSPRRTGFLLARRPDLKLHPLHGNVDTRLRRLDEGETDALVLACAGLDRLGLGARIAQRLDPELIPPAPGQGAIAVQVRRDDARMLGLLIGIDHAPTRLAVEAERAFLAASGGGCRAPIGALATARENELDLLGGYASPDGAEAMVAHRRGPRADRADLAREMAAELGPRRRVVPTGTAVDLETTSRRRVLVTRAAEQAEELVSALREAGVGPVLVPTIAVELEAAGGDLDNAARQLDTYAWVVISSANGARAVLNAAQRVSTPLDTPCWAALGPASRAVLEQAGIEIDHQPSQPNTITLAAELPVAPGDQVLVIRGDLADEELARALRARGAVVEDVVAYRTREAPESSRPLLRQALADGSIDAVLFTSGSTIRGLVALSRAEALDISGVPAVCIGPETAAEAMAAGFSVLAVSRSPEAAVLAATTADILATHEQEIR
jgi:hydroxymethylbilane synthase